MRRIALIGLALAAVVGSVAACSQPEPTVSFFSHGTTLSTERVRQCNNQNTVCLTADGGLVQTLRVPAGQPLQISVPDQIANSTWTVAFLYRDATGTVQEDRSAVFPMGTQYAYTLVLPTPSDQLLHVEVQQFGGISMAASDTAPSWDVTQVWAMNIST